MFNELSDILSKRLGDIYPKSELEIIEGGFSCEKRKTIFRVNTLKSSNEEIEEYFSGLEFNISKLDYLDNWYLLDNWNESDLWWLDVYSNGEIYIQWITSQLPVDKLNISEWMKVLDLAAAPGSKTSQLSAKLWNTWEIVACELSVIRAEKLKHNLAKQWCSNVKVIVWDSRFSLEKYPDNYFDIILFDAPCSGEWIILYHREKSYKWWDEKYIKKNYKLQKKILENNLRLLKPGWQLVYSTCTLAPEENEWIVHYLLCNFPELEIQDLGLNLHNTKRWIKQFWKFIYKNEVEKSLRILPSINKEWFYIAKFRRKL